MGKQPPVTTGYEAVGGSGCKANAFPFNFSTTERFSKKNCKVGDSGVDPREARITEVALDTVP